VSNLIDYNREIQQPNKSELKEAWSIGRRRQSNRYRDYYMDRLARPKQVT